MGGASSALNCTSKKKDKNKNNIEEAPKPPPKSILKAKERPAENQNLKNDIEAYESKVDGIRTLGNEVSNNVNPTDKDLVEEQIKKREKKYSDVKSRTDKLQAGYQTLELDLGEIQGKVDQYLAWLKKKEEQVVLTQPQGYDTRDAENRLQYINALCSDLENRQFTLDTVNKKVAAVLQDLTPRDREEMEHSVKALSKEHGRVYEVAVTQKTVLEESLNAREVFHVGNDRVKAWIQDKEEKASKLEKLKLPAVEVEKQNEKAKSLMVEVENFKPNMELVESRVRELQKDCNPEQAAELDNIYTDLKEKFEHLKEHINDVHNRVQTGLAARRVNETDLQKIERWCKEADMKCAVAPSLDCASEILREQYKQYKTLDTSAQMFDSLLHEVQDRSQTFTPTMSEADVMALQQSTKSVQDKYERLSKIIKDRLKSLEEALQTRDEVGDGVQEVSEWIEAIQNDLKKIPKSVGPTVNDAEDVLKQYEDVGEKIANYQPTIAQLNQAVERLRNLGQTSEADEILRVTSQYEMLGDQVRAQTQKCQQSVMARQHLEDQMKEIDLLVKDCEDSADSVIGLQVPVPEKIEKLKAVSTQLQSTNPMLFKMGDKAQQIGIEGTSNDARAVSNMIDDIKARVDNLKKISDRKIKQCESIQKNREDFEEFVAETITWLDSKEETLANCGHLDLDPVKVKSALQKHQEMGEALMDTIYKTKAKAKALARDALDKLDTIKMKAEVEKSHYGSMEEPIPDVLNEKLEQISALEDSIRGAIAKKEQYLTEASADRMQLELSMKQINDWLHGAEEMLDSGYEGLDYDTLNDTISEHKDYFSEASMCQDEMDQVMELSERLLPTLDMNDTETLRQSLKNTSQKLSEIMASSQRQQQEMEDRAREWNEYQDMVIQMTHDLQDLEEEWTSVENVPLNTPSNINKQLVQTKQFIEKAESLRPMMNEVNDRSHDLDKAASERSKAFIHQLLGEVNDKWKTLVAKTESKQMALQDLEAQYEDYSTLLNTVDQALDEADGKLPTPIDLDTAICPELVHQLDKAQEVTDVLETAEPKIVALKKCAHQLQKNLPTAEAKVQSQEIVMAMLERFERIGDQVKEQKQLLQEEIDDREGFNTEAKQTVEWLTETKTEVQYLTPSMEGPELMEKMEKLKLSEQEIAIRMEQMRHMAQLQETKFKSQGREIPRELQDQIAQMLNLEHEVTVTMATKEEELLHLKADRQAYSTEHKLVTTWLTQAQEQLHERIKDLPEAIYRHEELVSEFEPFKKNLDNLRTKGGELIKHSSDPIEKQLIQKQLADTNKLWLAVQSGAGEKTRQLREADALAKVFTETADAVELWLGQADAQLIAEPAWVDFEKVQEQLKHHKKLLKDTESQQNKLDHLKSIAKQMEPLCEVVPQIEKLQELNHKAFDIRAKTGDKVNELEDVNEQIQDFEVELGELKQWMEKTRAHLTMRDDSLTLKDQLHMQEIEKLQELNHKAFDIRAKTGDKVNELEDVNEQIQDFEVELGELKQWMEKTRAHLTMRDDSLTLKDQLHMQENLITDIEAHKGKALFVLQKHAELHAKVGEESRLHNTNLAAEINELLGQAHHDRDELCDAVAQQEKYEAEMRSLTASISEAQEQLIGSPIQASSVEDLKHQIAERNELAQQLKIYQARINELSEKSHNLAERSADLGPLCARKLYHSGDRETRVLDLVNALNAPLEPYISPLSSPSSPRQTAKYHYENPLKLYRGEEIGPITASSLEPSYESPRHSARISASNPDISRNNSRRYSLSLLKVDRLTPAVSLGQSNTKINPTVVLSPPSVDKIKPSVQLMTSISSPNVGKIGDDKQVTGHKHSTFTPKLEKGGSHTDSGVHFSPRLENGQSYTDSGVNFSPRSSGRSLDRTRVPLSELSLPNSEYTELSIEIPQHSASVPKRAHASDHEDDKTVTRAPKSLRSSADRGSNLSLDVGSVLSGSTDDPRSSVSHWVDTDHAETASLSSHPHSLDNKYHPDNQTDLTKPNNNMGDAESNKMDGQGDHTQPVVEDEMIALMRRKEEALKPFKPKSKYMAGTYGNAHPSDVDMEGQILDAAFVNKYMPSKTETEQNYSDFKIKPASTTQSKGPMKADHDKYVQKDTFSAYHRQPHYPEGHHLYVPHAPSPLTLDRPSRSRSADTGDNADNADGSHNGLQRHSRSVSPRTVGHDDEEYLWLEKNGQRSASPRKPRDRENLSKSLTSTQIRSMSPAGKHLRPVGGGFNSDLSRSVPSLLDPQLQGLRDRSSSIGSRSRFGGSGSGSFFGSRNASRSSKFDELNSSWQNLQKQLGTKERELQLALQKQERYQSTVQDVTARMERVQQKLSSLGSSPFKDVEKQIKDHKEAEQEIEAIREDIARVKERGRQIMETSDPEGYQAMQATLTMLTDKIENLQAMADDKAKQLQNVMKGKERQKIAMTAYKKHVKDIENWMEEMKVRQAATPLSTDTVPALQQQLQENKDLQNELNLRLQHVADLAIQCDNLCEMETPESADKLRSQLATLQQNLGNLKLGAIEKQAPLRSAIKESEKRTREMSDYESSVKNLQKWIADTKMMTQAPPTETPVTMTSVQKQELQQQLQSDLFQHKNLVRQISTEMKTRDRPTKEVTLPSTFTPVREEDIQPRWEALSKQLEQKKQDLQEIIDKSKDLIGPNKYGRRNYGRDTSPQLNDIRRHLGQLNDLWKQLQVQVDDKQLRLEKALEFQQRYQDALQNVSGWLDITQQKLFAPDSTMNSEEKVKENEDIQREIKSLQGEILSMGKAAQELLTMTSADSHDLIRHSLGNLNDRVNILENQAKEQGEKLRSVDRNYKLYKEEVHNLESKMLETRDMMSSPGPAAPLHQKVNQMQKIESQLKICESHLDELKRRQAELSALDPEIISPYEMDTLQANFMDLQRKVMEKKASLQESVSVQEQYEKLLQDYADFLETAEDKLKTEQINAKDLDHLKQQLIAHKDFFSDLEVHRAMLDSLVSQCDKATKQKHLPQHTRLSNLTYVLLDKASLHGQRLERLVKQWAEMDEKFGQLQRSLSDLETQIPKPISNDDTLATIQAKINTYQRLQRELTDEKPMVFEVVDKGKQLLHSINCPVMEMMVTDLAEKWVSLNTDLSQELKRSQSLGDQLQVFEAEASILRSWLTAARSKLTGIKQLSSTDMKSIATVRSKIDKILEFRKDVENQLALKEKVQSIGNQLLQSQVYQTTDLEDRMKYLDHEWAQLEHDINNTEEYLHQAQMDLMPSRQALAELNAWLQEIEETLQGEKSKPLKTLADMEVLLKKYKSYKIDLTSKQLTVDFVNQDVLQPKDEMDGPPPAERNEFSERLGTLNSRWQDVSRHVSDRLKTLEAIHNKWEEFEKSVTRLIGWFHEQEDKLKKYRLIGHEVSVRQTLKDVKGMRITMKAKQVELNSVKEVGEVLVQLSEDSPNVRACIQESLANIEKQRNSLDTSLNQVHHLLEDILSQWDSYHNELQVVNQTLSETEYCLQRYNLIGGDIATLKIQVEKLESLMSDMERHASKHEKFMNLATRLVKICEAPTRQEIKRTQSDIQARWQNMFSELKSRTEKFRDCLEQWTTYEEGFNAARVWLEAKEKLCDELLYGKEQRIRRDDNLKHCKALQQELDGFQTQLSNLYRVGDDVTKNMDPASIVNITSKLSGLEQRTLALRQKLGKHIQSLQGDLSQQRRFQEAFDNVKAFVSQAQRILSMEDPNKSADEKALSDRLEHLKELSAQFSDNSTQLDSLNDLGYRMALNETLSAELQDLNHKWHDLYNETKERCKSLQGMLLVQQDFTSKCDTWMTFLAQTESDLSTEIAGNLIDLQVQQRKCEKFEAEMYSRQQILHSIISDGQTMMGNGDIENKEEFQQKLHLLADQWQSVVRRANQRKAIIDSTVKQWLNFNDMSEKLREWLAEKEEALQVFTFDTASLQKIKNLVEKSKQMQNEFKLQEDLFKNMNSQGKQLVQRADDKAAEELRVSMAQVQQHWHQIFVKLDGERERLEGVLRQWQECEDDIEDILTWLKDTRKTLANTLPTAYEELQADMHRCKDIESAFQNAEPKRQTLLASERSLSKTIEPEDLNVLHQRIRLLNKQWDELRNQASIRGQRIDDTMFRWSSFSEKFKEMCDWIDRMEVKVVSSKDFHIEDLLHRMQKDFKDELSDKEKYKNDLINQGRALMKVSNEVRSSDIEQKIIRLEDKWEHLKAVIGFRQRKLQETLLAVQQLDVSMSNLRKWLMDMENELSAPLVYKDCERRDIQNKLSHQSELQHDIERHSPGVGSVLNLCEVLLHDSDACPTDVEFNGLQTAMKNLERRWRNICQMAPERRTRIDETWQLWQTLLDDCRIFSEWLHVMEEEVTEVTTEDLDVSMSSEEYSKCETVQRKIHQNLSKLENINRQYRRLAREGRTDTSGTLKTMMQDANDRWDRMQARMSTNLRQLKHSASIREDFKHTKDSLTSWLTEIDMQLTNIEHLSSMDIPMKLREMKRIQDEIASRKRKFEFLDEAGLYLIQKGDSTDAITTQAELDSFRQYHRQVLDRVAITNAKLSALQSEERFRLNEAELDQLERELYSLGPGESLSIDWDMKEIEAYLEASPPESPPEKRRALLKKLRERSRSRSASPSKKLPSVTAATLTAKLESQSQAARGASPSRQPRSTSPTRSRSPTRSALLRSKAKSPRRVAKDFVDGRAHSPSRQARFNKMKTELSHRAKESEVEAILEKLADALEEAAEKLDRAEQEMKFETPVRAFGDRHSLGYLKSMEDAENCVEDVRTIQRLLKAETGLRNIDSADTQVRAIVQRWEVLQATAIQKDYRFDQHRKEWSQFKTDVDNMMTWLDEAEVLQHKHKPLPGEITKLDSIIRQHKDFLVQLEAKKTRVVSINLTSRELIDPTTEDGRQMRDRLKLMNKRWDAVCSQATRLQEQLQQALMQCQEFHHTIHDLLLWLEGIEGKIQKCEPVNLGSDEAALWTRLRKLQDIRFELDQNQPKVMSLRDTADQLLMNCDSPEMAQAKDKMHIIANRLKALLRLCSSYITSLETRLDSKPLRSPDRSFDLSGSSAPSSGQSSPRDLSVRTSTPTRPYRPASFRPISSSSGRSRARSPFALSRQLLDSIGRIFAGLFRPLKGRPEHEAVESNIEAEQMGAISTVPAEAEVDTDEEDAAESRCCPLFISRLLRMALPLQLLLLLLLAFASFVPMTEDDYSCTLANNFKRSLEPMLQYTDGPPPV